MTTIITVDGNTPLVSASSLPMGSLTDARAVAYDSAMFDIYHIRIHGRDYVASDVTAARAVARAMALDEESGGDHGASVSIHCSRRVGRRAEMCKVRRAEPEIDGDYRERVIRAVSLMKLPTSSLDVLTGRELDAVGAIFSVRREQVA